MPFSRNFPGLPDITGVKIVRKEVNIENLILKERIVVLAVLSAVTLGAWVYMFHMSPGIIGIIMGGDSPYMLQWGLLDIFFSFVMWSVMMMAMMLPSAIPMILMFTSANRRRIECHDPLITTGLFVLGYLIIWIAYSALATMVQWGLHAATLLLHKRVITSHLSALLGGTLLLATGVFQWTPFRNACMIKCRSPLGFILAEWREGKRGALIMGLKHGAFCVGCCWLIMALSLFLGGMNILWMLVLTAFIILEKSSVAGQWLSRVAGLVFIVWGLAVIVVKGVIT